MQRMVQRYVKPGSLVYDIGSYDVNGCHRPIVLAHPASYIGVDITRGPNVDLVVRPYCWDPLPVKGCECIISGSCLEHVPAPWEWAKELALRLAPGGVAIVHLPFSLGEHRYPVDCYRILPDGLRHLFVEWAGLIELECAFNEGDKDTYFVGRGP